MHSPYNVACAATREWKLKRGGDLAQIWYLKYFKRPTRAVELNIRKKYVKPMLIVVQNLLTLEKKSVHNRPATERDRTVA